MKGSDERAREVKDGWNKISGRWADGDMGEKQVERHGTRRTEIRSKKQIGQQTGMQVKEDSG